MNFFLFIYVFIAISCAKPLDPITWKKCGQSVGLHPCNFTLKNQEGNDWTLYDSYGTPILVEFSAEWCYWCHEASASIAQLKKIYNFKHVTILLESRTGKPADQRLAKKWADLYNSSEPVLYGWDADFGWPFEGLPSFYMISDKMLITQKIDGWHPRVIEHFIKEEQK